MRTADAATAGVNTWRCFKAPDWQPLRPRLQQLLLQHWPQRLNHLINRAASPPPVALVALHPSGGLAGYGC